MGGRFGGEGAFYFFKKVLRCFKVCGIWGTGKGFGGRVSHLFKKRFSALGRYSSFTKSFFQRSLWLRSFVRLKALREASFSRGKSTGRWNKRVSW